MKHRMLGDGLEVSTVGLGCMGFTHAYGLPSERQDAVIAIHAAVDAGYTFFDTAECYIGENAELLALIRELAADHDATPAQISLAWMICKKPYIVPIPGSRRVERILENGKAADIVLSEDEVSAIDERLGNMKMSEVFGGSTVKTG